MEVSFKRISVVLCLVLMFTIGAMAQTTTGSISGQVTDPSGAVVAGANVTVTNPTTARDYTTVTGADGSFAVVALPVGFYNVKVNAKGFSDAVFTDVKVDLGGVSKVSAKLNVATAGTEVVVTGEQQSVQTDTVTITAAVDRRQIMNLPLSTRNPLDLVKTMAGAVMVGSINDFIVHGLRPNTVNLMQDGVNVSDNYVKTSGFFSLIGATVDSVSEFSVNTSASGTDSGFGSTQVNMVTQGGSNALHGAVYWYNRTNYLNANSYFNNLTGVKTPFQLQNRIGEQVGGPIILPHIYNGKNKTFFFQNFEVFRQPVQQNTNRLILSDAARTGNFTYTRVDNGQKATVNLLSLGTMRNSTGAAVTPAINQAVMGYYNAIVPSANNDACSGTDAVNMRCFSWNVPGSGKSNRYVGRIDQNIGDHHVASFVMNLLRTRTQSDFLNGDYPFFPNAKGAGQGGIRELWSWSLRSTFGPNKTNNATFGIQRSPVDFFINDDYKSTGGFQLVTPGNLSNISFVSTNLPQGRNTPVWELSDNFGWVRNRHNIQFGGDYRQVKATNYFYNAVQPNVNLGNNTNNTDGLSSTSFAGGISSTGLSNAQNVFDTITGMISSTVQGFNHTSATSGFVAGKPRLLTPIQHNFAFYGNDTWRVMPILTVQYGLRWEFQGVFDDRSGLVLQPDNRLQGIFGPSAVGSLFAPSGTLASSDVLLNLSGGHNNKPLYNRDWNNFAPFVGVAIDPFKDGKTVIRSGFSTHYTNDGFTLFASGITGNTGLFSTLTNATPQGTFNPASVPTPPVPADVIPVSARGNFGLGTAATVSNSMTIFNQNLPVPYVMEWNLAVQREVAKNTTVEARYIGNHAVKLYRTSNYNELNLFNSPFTGIAGTASAGVSVANILTEFNNAANNLNVCIANRAKCATNNFSNQGIAGQVPLPIFDALFKGLALGSGYTNSTFITNLQQGTIGTMFDSLRRTGTFFTNRQAFAQNFFVANPWTNGANLIDNSSWSNYNGFEFELRHRATKGLSFQANYTLGKVMTDQRFANSQTESQNYITLANRAADKGRASYDIRHNVAGNFLYQLPFGRGQAFGSNANQLLDLLIGGWNFQGVVNWSSGIPFSIVTGRATTGSLLSTNVTVRNMTNSQLQNAFGVFKIPGAVSYINPNSGLTKVTTTTGSNGLPSTTSTAVMCTAGQTTPCFDFTAPGQYGNSPYLGFEGPDFFNTDASIIKKLNVPQISEKFNVEFRLEAFNALNHANFRTPDGQTGATVTSTQFGLLTTLIDTSRGNGAISRNMQWAIRVNF